ncbi:TolC family protein [Acinetobacter rudis]|uniref:TolC family protein n=1 Tax=Acinetobacter rudis TaxID=632955 RepID=UPI0028103C5D|nr:TolC family protein [Acinetobacter rudis]MDQ8951755.1 TolC family protein [Acinetobacter rudis]
MITQEYTFKNGFLLILLLAGLQGCVSPQKPALPQTVLSYWDAQSSSEGQLIALRSWWKSFHDPALDQLVDEALKHNLDIAQASELLLKARRLNGQLSKQYFPQVTAGVQPVQDAAARENFIHASVDMTWELSLYGESEYRKQIGEAVILSAEAREQAVRIATVASIVESYLRYSYTNQQLELVKQQLALETQLQNLISIRQKAHIATVQEQLDSKLRVARLQAKYSDLTQIQDQSARVLALLTGKNRTDIIAQLGRSSPSIPTIHFKQMPADLLRTRPDIRQAEADVLQAAGEVGLARAALYPRLILSGSLLLSYNVTDNYNYMGGRSTPGFGPVIDIPLWDWGQRRNEKHAKEHELQAALIGYRKTVLAGVSETEEALSALAYQDQRIHAFDDAVAQQKGLAQMQLNLKKLGLSSDYDGLAGQTQMLEIESELTESRFNKAIAVVTLYKALGGAPLSAMTTSLATKAEEKQ